MTYLGGRTEVERARVRGWAREIARLGIQVFAEGAYMSLAKLKATAARRGLTMPRGVAAEQRGRRAFLAHLWSKRVIRQWFIVVDDVILGVEEPDTEAPAFLAGENWDAFAAELQALTGAES